MTENQQKYLRTANNNARMLTHDTKTIYAAVPAEHVGSDAGGSGIIKYLSIKFQNTAQALVRAGAKTKKQ